MHRKHTLLKKFLWILLIAGISIALGTAAYLAGIGATKTGARTDASYDYEVTYTANGFSPSLLQIPIGARVAFKNTTDGPMWTAADPYPTHADYPDFDAKRTYASGETYIFQFNKGGTFGYSNDAKPIDHGFIEVTDPATPAFSIDNVVPAQRPTRDKLLALFKPGDTDSIFTVFDAIAANPALASNCHEIGHDLGHRAYELYGFSGAMTYSNPNRVAHAPVESICAGGYMHGILEELFLHQPELQNNPGIMCSYVPSDNRASCYHGVGHALMFVNKRDVAASLAGCRSLPQASDTSRCFEGVYMELFWGDTDHSGPNTLNWDLTAPLAPCIATEADAKPACFLYSSFGYLRTHAQDYSGAVALCTNSSLNQADEGFCLQGIGITMISHFKSQHLERAEPLVDGLSYADKHSFYQGVLGFAFFSGVSKADLTSTCELMQNDTAVCDDVLASIK